MRSTGVDVRRAGAAIGTGEGTAPRRDGPTSVRTGRAEANGHLKLVLKSLDLCGLVLGWWLAYRSMLLLSAVTPLSRRPLTALAVVGIAASLVVMASKRLWLSRVCAVRSTELEGLGQTTVWGALVVLATGQLIDYDLPDRFALLGGLYSFVLLVTLRSTYTAWLRRERRRGGFVRRLVLVGANPQADHLRRLVSRHPDSGYEIVGVCGPPEAVTPHDDLPWLGGLEQASSAVSDAGAHGALVVGSALDPGTLNATVRQLLRAGHHVHLASGMSGISHERLLPLPLAREPLFYLEQTSLTRSQLMIKRVLDLVLSAVLCVVVLPTIVAAAIAIKLDDGGPVFFRQQRVGHRGRLFTLYKLRTMVPDAEQRRAEYERHNHRDGPLFKVVSDPRITRVGHWLRTTSLDELPQLFNVLRGDMSLVGPRPALPHEVAQFDDELQLRSAMMPGITGLWQVEARDDPSFDSYRRLDLFYVENWSVSLDLSIIAATVWAVAVRTLRPASSSRAA